MSKLADQVLWVIGGGDIAWRLIKYASDHGYRIKCMVPPRFINESFLGLKSDAPMEVQFFEGSDLDILMVRAGDFKDGDLAISISSPWIFRKNHIDFFCHKLVNLHNQPLPLYRGGGGLIWNILNQDRRGGCSIHLVSEDIDAGEIVLRRIYEFPADLRSNIEWTHYSNLKAFDLLLDWFSAMVSDHRPPPSEDQGRMGKATYWPRISSFLCSWIDWSWHVNDIKSFCDAFESEFGSAKCYLGEEQVQIKQVSVLLDERYHPFQDGLIFRESDSGFHVAHHSGTLVVGKIEGTTRRVRVGDRLFTPIKCLEDTKTSRVRVNP